MTVPIPYIDETGIHRPDLAEVVAGLEGDFQAIYGSDMYLEPDSQDGQLIGIFATAFSDLCGTAVAVYNSFSPQTAQGVGLSTVVKINGIARAVPTFSSVDLYIVGQAGSTITDGVATDAAGNRWLLPASVTIPFDGDITVTATAAEPGAVTAPADTITTIATPTKGWQTVTNPASAAAGSPVESDAALRRRQTTSTAIPSQTVLEGIVGAIAALPGVVRYKPYENDTNSTDADTLPAHSISLIVEGGDAMAIAQAIADKKTPGAYTYGTTNQTITDRYGVPHVIHFYRPTDVSIKVALSVTPMAGYTTAIQAAIKQAIVDWINALDIGEDVEFAEIYVPANLNGAAERRTYKITSMTIAKNAGTPGASDIVIAFNEAPIATLTDITIT